MSMFGENESNEGHVGRTVPSGLPLEGSDHHIIFGCVRDHPCFGYRHYGSPFISDLVTATKVVEKQILAKEEYLKRLKNISPGNPYLRLENLIGGWMEDIGTSIRRNGLRALLMEHKTEEVDISQPECLNTLTKMLSWIKIFESQSPNSQANP